MRHILQNKILINSSYAELLPSFNDDLQSAVDAALQRYLIDEIAAKIAGLKKKEKLLRLKYGCDYKTFSQRTAEDEEYINQIENSTRKLWGSDLADWEFCEKGINDWTRKLQSIVLLS